MSVFDAITPYLESGILPSIGWLIFGGIILLIIAGAITAGIIWYIYAKSLNKIVIRFERVGGFWQSTGRFKGKFKRIGRAGAEALYVPKLKRWFVRPAIQSGPNIYWFAVGKDGEWRNFGIEDIDEKLVKMNVKFVDADMRYANTELEQALQNEFSKPGFWERYGTLIISIIFIFIVSAALFFIAREQVHFMSEARGAISSLNEAMKTAKEVIGALDSLKGSGTIQPAT